MHPNDSTSAPPTTAVPPPTDSRPVPPALMTEAEACRFLRVSRVAVLKFRRNPLDPIPCFKVGRRYLYERGDLLKWAKRQAARAHREHRP